MHCGEGLQGEAVEQRGRCQASRVLLRAAGHLESLQSCPAGDPIQKSFKQVTAGSVQAQAHQTSTSCYAAAICRTTWRLVLPGKGGEIALI